MFLCLDYIAYLDDAQLAALCDAVANEAGAREREASRIEKSEAAKASKRQTACPKCGLPPTRKGKAGTPTREMILSAARDRIEGGEGTVLTHDGAPSHNLLAKSLGVRDDWHRFVAGDPDYEKAMATMSNCCGYLRHSFESHQGIKFAKLEAYGNFFLYRWSHMRKGGLEHSIDCTMTRLCSTPKSHLFDDYGKKGEIWSR